MFGRGHMEKVKVLSLFNGISCGRVAFERAGIEVEKYVCYVLDQVEEQYDYCLIDCPPGVGINVLNALAAADDVIIPIKADKNALDGMEELTEVIEEIRPYNPGLSLVKCLVTMFTNDISVVKGEEALRKSEYSTFNTHIRYSKKVVDWTYEKRKSLIETTPRSAATRDYKSLAAEYIRLTRKEG